MSDDLVDIEDPAALVAYLRGAGRIGARESVEIRNLAGGVSNKTVLVRRAAGEAWVLKQALSKLRVQADWFSDPARVRREALGLQWLNQLVPGITPALVFQDDRQFLLAMRAVPEPHENWKAQLLVGRVEPGAVVQFGQMLAAVHTRGYVRRGEIAVVFDDRSFFESLRLEPYYAYTAGEVPAAQGFLEDLITATRARRFTLVHGDYSPKNILVHAGRLVLLDHEVIHFGDPAFDLGFALTHLLSKAHHLRACRRQFLQAAHTFWKVYRARLGDVPWAGELEAFAVRHALGCMLARVAGRSPLEYLTPLERERQAQVVMRLTARPPTRVGKLVARFAAHLDKLD